MLKIVLMAGAIFAIGFGWPEIKQWWANDGTLAGAENAAATNAGGQQASRETEKNSEKFARTGWHEIAIPRTPNGHFIVDVAVNGTTIPFLIDSGASDVVLSASDAKRVGLGGPLRYDLRYQTANGIVRAAPVQLREMRIGQLALRSIDASVNEGEMGISLLGMSFLNQLRGFEYDGDQLILRW